MSVLFNRYNFGFRIVSIAFDEDTKNDLLKNSLDILYVNDNNIILLPDNYLLSDDCELASKIVQYSNYDVFEIWPNGYLKQVFDMKSSDTVFFITGRCNSNCVMCPSPESMRRDVRDSEIASLVEIAKHIPANVSHITITGGEPFLVGRSIFDLFDFLKIKFVDTEFLILTNGRVFAIKDFVDRLICTIPNNCTVGIPIHGSNKTIHDKITQTSGSFSQTMTGIKRLLAENIRVELRIVVSKLNLYDFKDIVDMVIDEIPDVHHISIIAMEMTGNAYINSDELWIPYSEVFDIIKNDIRKLIVNEIDVKLYNFPLCAVDKKYWTLCEKSISKEKIRFDTICEKCLQKNACGGVFAGTIRLERDDLKVLL